MRKLDEHEKRALAILLGRADAIHWPFRIKAPRDEVRQHVAWEHYSAYHAAGLSFKAGGADAARKREQRAREGLVEVGLIEINSPRSSAPRIRLTSNGDGAARRLVGIPTIHEGFELIDRMHKLRNRASNAIYGSDDAPVVYIHETTLVGTKSSRPDYKARLHDLNQRFATLAVRRLAEYVSNCRGWLWFRLTEEGVELARKRAKGDRSLPHVPSDFEADDDLTELYVTEWQDLYWGMAAMEVQNASELGPVPMELGPPTIADRRRQRKQELPECI